MVSKVIHTAHLFPILDKKLIDLLRSLPEDEWKRKTRARQWTVKDVATHLLDGNIRTLSISRDKYFGDPPNGVNSHETLVAYLNQLNASWVNATARLSPKVLIELLKVTGKEYCEHFRTADLNAPAIFSVGWAGEETSVNWFHIAREYTEKWHHQQQIREAVGKPGIESEALYAPVLETFMRALPFHYSKIEATPQKSVTVKIAGDAGGIWTIASHENQWRFIEPSETKSSVTIHIHQDHAWKLLTKGLSLEEAKTVSSFDGDTTLGLHFLTMLSVMA